MKLSSIVSAFVLAGAVTGCMTSKPETMGNLDKKLDMASFFIRKGCST